MNYVQESLIQDDERVSYENIIKTYPWIVEENHNCILSPDTDGLLCGLFMSNYLNWNIRGFYDGKIMLLDKNYPVTDCIFLDMEIYRDEIRSVGHHMVQFNKNRVPNNWKNFDNCIQPNNIRNYDGYKNFSLKYPFATIHLLLGILSFNNKIKIPNSALCPLLYVDGVFKNLFGYPENCIDWLKFLQAESNSNALNEIFFNDHYNVYNLMLALKDFFLQISNLSETRVGNDKIKISNTKGEPVNIIRNKNGFGLDENERQKAIKYLKILSELTGWKLNIDNWQFSNYEKYIFKKQSTNPNNRNFDKMIRKNPISWAMTSGLSIEYTLDNQKLLLK